MKILRIDNQGVCEERIYDSLEDLRLQLISFHSIDWEGEKEDGTPKDINALTLEDICDYGDWSYEILEEKV